MHKIGQHIKMILKSPTKMIAEKFYFFLAPLELGFLAQYGLKCFN